MKNGFGDVSANFKILKNFGTPLQGGLLLGDLKLIKIF